MVSKHECGMKINIGECFPWADEPRAEAFTSSISLILWQRIVSMKTLLSRIFFYSNCISRSQPRTLYTELCRPLLTYR